MSRRWPLFRRRKILVRRFQVRFVVTSLVWFATTLLVTAALVFLPLALELRSSTPSPESLSAANTILALHEVFWPWMGILLVLYAVHITHLSHRIAGPLARFHSVFGAIEQGSVADHIRLRRNDYLHDEAAAFNSALEALRRHHSALREQVNVLEAQLEDLAASPEKAAESSAARLMPVIVELRSLRAEIERIHIESHTIREPGQDAAVRLIPLDASRAGRSRSQGGFTLIEMMIVAALVATLAAIAIPAYAEAVNSARITRAISDIRAIGHALQMHAIMRGSLPATLAEADVQTLNDPWGNPYVYVVIPPGDPNPGGVRKDRNLHPLNSDFDLYSKGRDGDSVLPLTAKASQDDIVRASDGGFIGLAAQF